jgi:hypothetical protein
MFTPGPWTFNEENGRIADQNDNPVAYISGRARQFGKERLTTACFNGRLIAAAPDLLQATKDLLRAFDELMPGLAHISVEDYANVNTAPIRARQAIEKAEVA